MAPNNKKGAPGNMPKKGEVRNPAGRPKGSKNRVMTKSGQKELEKLGFNPLEMLVELYKEVTEELESEKFSSHVWHASIRNTQRGILECLVPYAVHKVEVDKDLEARANKLAPVVINMTLPAEEQMKVINSTPPAEQPAKAGHEGDEEE